MPDVEHYTKEQIGAALTKTFGIQLAAARLLKCDRMTVKNYIDRYPELRDVIAEAKESRIDIAEAKLMEMVGDAHFAATRFALEGSREGRERGWGTKPQVQIEVDNRRLLVNVESIREALDVETGDDMLVKMAGLLESGDMVEGEAVEPD